MEENKLPVDIYIQALIELTGVTKQCAEFKFYNCMSYVHEYPRLAARSTAARMEAEKRATSCTR